MRLLNRLERLEDELGTRRCPQCGGQGPFVVSRVVEDEPVPEVKGCPACGDVSHIIIRYCSRPLPDGRIMASGASGAQVASLLD